MSGQPGAPGTPTDPPRAEEPTTRDEGRRDHADETPRRGQRAARTGRFSDDLPEELRARYEDARAAFDLLSLHEDIALIDALIREKLATLAAGRTTRDWDRLRRRATRLADNLAVWDWDRLDREARDLAEALERRQDEAAVVEE